jgi:hypothetical protein
MITENDIVNALAQCRTDPTQIGNALYGLYNHHMLRIKVCRRLNHD